MINSPQEAEKAFDECNDFLQDLRYSIEGGGVTQEDFEVFYDVYEKLVEELFEYGDVEFLEGLFPSGLTRSDIDFEKPVEVTLVEEPSVPTLRSDSENRYVNYYPTDVSHTVENVEPSTSTVEALRFVAFDEDDPRSRFSSSSSYAHFLQSLPATPTQDFSDGLEELLNHARRTWFYSDLIEEDTDDN